MSGFEKYNQGYNRSGFFDNITCNSININNRYTGPINSGSEFVLPAPLQSIADLTTTGNEIIYTIATNTYDTSPITPIGRSFLTIDNQMNQQIALGLQPGVNIQPYNSILTTLTTIPSTANNMIYTSGGTYTTTPVTSFARTDLLTQTSATSLNTLLDTITEGTAVSTANRLVKVDGTRSITETGISIDGSNNMTGVNNITAGGTVNGVTQSEFNQIGNMDQNVNTTAAVTFDILDITNTIDMNNNRIQQVGAPVAGTDATTKDYVDNVAASGLRPLTAVQFATAAVLPNAPVYASPAETLTSTAGAGVALVVDGVAMVVGNNGDRVLVKDQAANTQNGVYTITDYGGGAGAWQLTRATDFNEAATPISQNSFLFVEGGNTMIGTQWILQTTVNNIDPLTDPVIFSQFGGSQVYMAGDGIDIIGNTISVDLVAGTPLTFTIGELDLNTVTTEYGGTGVSLVAGDTNRVFVSDAANGTNPIDISKSAPAGDFIGTTDIQTMTNKTMTSNTNNLISRGLFSQSGVNTVSTYASAGPIAGDVLTATGAATAVWQAPTTFAPARTYFVYTGAPDISPNYSNLQNAVAALPATSVTNPFLIQIYPGTYTTTATTIPAFVCVSSPTTHALPVILRPNAAGITVLTLNGNARIANLIVDGETVLGSGVYAAVGIHSIVGTVGSIDICHFVTVNNCSTANFRVTGNGAQFSKFMFCNTCISQCNRPTTVTNGFLVELGGVFNGDNNLISAFLSGGVGTITNGVNVINDYSFFDSGRLTISACANGCVVGTGVASNSRSAYPVLRIIGSNLGQCSAIGLWAREKSVCRLSDFRVHEDVLAIPTHILVDNPVLPAEPNAIIGMWISARADKIRFLGGATNNPPLIIGSNLSEVPNQYQTIITGDLGVGLPNNGFDTNMGQGASHTFEMVVFVYDATANTSTNRTSEATGIDGSTFSAFPSPTPLTTNDALYIGGNSTFSTYPGIRITLTTAIISTGSTSSDIAWEFWNGAAWATLPFMATDATAPFDNKGNISFGQNDTIITSRTYQYRFGSISTWATANDGIPATGIVYPPGPFDATVLRYYIRARVTASGAANITTIPVIEQIRLQTNQTKVNTVGFEEFFGTARSRQQLQIPLPTLTSTGIAGETAPSTQRLVATTDGTSIGTISSNRPTSLFANLLTTTACFIFIPPESIDTSMDGTVQLTFSRSTAATGNVALRIDYTFIADNDIIGNTAGAVNNTIRTSGTLGYPISATTRGVTTVTIPISFADLRVANNEQVWVKLSRFGVDALDTYTSDIYMIAINVQYFIWANGSYV